MKTWTKWIGAAILSVALAGAAAADTLELKDGRVLQGKFLGGTQAILRFQVDGDVQTFSTNDIVALTFTRGSSQPQQMPAPAAPTAPAQPPAPAAPAVSQNNYDSSSVTLPAGQSLLVRMIDGVDSSKNHVGDIFHATLETDLNVNGQVVARKGADVLFAPDNRQIQLRCPVEQAGPCCFCCKHITKKSSLPALLLVTKLTAQCGDLSCQKKNPE